MKRSFRKQKRSKRPSLQLNQWLHFVPADYVLAFIVLALTIFGVIMVYNTSVVVAYEEFGDKYWFLKNQVKWAIIGIVFASIFRSIQIIRLKKYAPMALGVSVVLLVLVLVPGFAQEVYGSHQRLIVPGVGVSFQPSELVKLSLTFYLAYLFSMSRGKKQPFPYKQFIGVVGLVVGLTAIEPDLGNATLIAGSAFVVFIAAGASILQSVVLAGAGVVGGALFAMQASYRSDRITDFIALLTGSEEISYHITQIFIALGSGGIMGLGLGNSRQKYQFIPEVTTDSIFAIIGEELGFIGALLVIVALVYIIWRGIKIASDTDDEFARLVAIGITANIGLQTIVNLGGMVGIMPLTGVPLPFISYGGSSLTLLLISVGVLLSISRGNLERSRP